MRLLLSRASFGILLTTAAVQVDAFTIQPPRALVGRRLWHTTTTASTTSHFLASQSSVLETTTVQWSSIKDVKIQTLDGKTVEVGSVVSKDDATIVLSCLSHFGDFNAWELTQQYLSALESEQIASNRYEEYKKYKRTTAKMVETGKKCSANEEQLGIYRGWLCIILTFHVSLLLWYRCYYYIYIFF
jgi:hypothetical protein